MLTYVLVQYFRVGVIGENSYIGAGATVIQGTVIGSDVTVGAGSVVISDVPDGVMVKGVPAK